VCLCVMGGSFSHQAKPFSVSSPALLVHAKPWSIPELCCVHAEICTAPAAYTCTGSATSAVDGTCTAVVCATGYSGSPSVPSCTSPSGTWTFTGACTGQWGDFICVGRVDMQPAGPISMSSPALPFHSKPSSSLGCCCVPAEICTAPAAYTCTGSATSAVDGTCTAVVCTTGYTGSPSAPSCTSPNGVWAFTGTCAGKCRGGGDGGGNAAGQPTLFATEGIAFPSPLVQSIALI